VLRVKKFSRPAFARAAAVTRAGRSTDERLCRVGTTGKVPWTTLPWRSVAALTDRALRGTRPFAKSSAETVVIALRTRGLRSAPWKLEEPAPFRTFVTLVMFVTLVIFVMFTELNER